MIFFRFLLINSRKAEKRATFARPVAEIISPHAMHAPGCEDMVDLRLRAAVCHMTMMGKGASFCARPGTSKQLTQWFLVIEAEPHQNFDLLMTEENSQLPQRQCLWTSIEQLPLYRMSILGMATKGIGGPTDRICVWNRADRGSNLGHHIKTWPCVFPRF
jgi:hypothetical protein